MEEKSLLDELVESIGDDKQKKLVEAFKKKHSLGDLEECFDKIVRDDLDET
jgi:hypothetical protein